MRHGLTESNKRKVYAGWSDEELSQEGIQSLWQSQKKIEKLNIEKIFTSPIRRAVQTAEILNRFLNVPIEILAEIKEMKMGPWEGLSEEEVAVKYPKQWRLWNVKPSKLLMYGRESLKELQNRSLKGINKIKGQINNSNFLLITHVAIMRVLMIYYNGLSLDDYRKLDVQNASIFKLDLNDKNGKITKLI